MRSGQNFLNRIDEIILFSPLDKEDMHRIVKLQMEDIQSRLSEHGLSVEMSSEAVEWMANTGYDPAFGARPLKRALQKYVESPLSMSLLAGEFQLGDTVLVEIENEEVVFKKKGKK